jgi:hypothetical protein
MNQRFKETIGKLSLQHLYALLVGAILFLFGCWLSFRYSLGRPYGRLSAGYHQRGYGLATIAIAITFCRFVVLLGLRDHEDKPE